MAPAPHVTAIMPARDDAAHLEAAAVSVLGQRYGGTLDLIIAVGPSADGTERLAEAIGRDHHAVSVVANPTGGTAAGLNAALDAATGSVIARVDAHCELPPDYVRTAVDALARTGAANVGGVQAAEGTAPYQRAVAAAMSSRFGVGDAKFHYGGEPGPTDTVYLGVFDAAALREVGGFDETLVRNQDYELNWRLRQAGHIVYFEPAMVVRYRPRDTATGLARQYFQYGRWKREVLRRHPRSIRARQLVAPITVAGCTVGVLGALSGRRWMLVAPAGYLTAVVIVAATTGSGLAERARLATIFPTMHLSWGAGFLVGAPRHTGRESPVPPHRRAQ